MQEIKDPTHDFGSIEPEFLHQILTVYAGPDPSSLRTHF